MENTVSFPYFLPPLIKAYYEALPGSHEHKLLALKIRANIGDYDILEKILGNNIQKMKKENPASSSFDTIDSFLNKFSPPKLAGAYLPEVSPQEELNQKLHKLIINQQYKEAIEIIERRNLNNPKKNIYFADQIRFLKKLMTISKNKNN